MALDCRLVRELATLRCSSELKRRSKHFAKIFVHESKDADLGSLPGENTPLKFWKLFGLVFIMLPGIHLVFIFVEVILRLVSSIQKANLAAALRMYFKPSGLTVFDNSRRRWLRLKVVQLLEI